MSFPDKKISALIAGALHLDCQQEIVTLDRDRVHIRGKSLRLLYVLMVHSQTVLTKEQLIDKVWDGRAVSDSVLTTAMKELRKALKDTAKNPHYIQTLHGRGYRFLQPVQTVRDAGKKASADAREGVFPTEPAQRPKAHIFGLAFLAVFSIALLAWFFSDEQKPAGTGVPSIAVLPFVNMSDDPDNEYFSDGISEELLNLLAQVPELRVTSRTSAFSFRGKDVDIPTIAEQLNVTHVLEGSVRKSGNQVRITAQLIEARSDTHLWSGNYERTLDDIFATQDAIAAMVVEQLKLRLLGDPLTVAVVDPEAYTLFLQARYLGRKNTPEAYEKSIALLKQALAVAPDYAAAWAGLARGYANQAYQGLRPVDEGYRLAREAARQSLIFDPNYVQAHRSLAAIARNYDRDLVTAARHYERALAIAPTNIDSISNAAIMAASLDRLDQAIALAEFAVARDPVNPIRNSNMGVYYFGAERFDEAIASFHTTLTLSPGYLGAHYRIGTALLLKGEPQAALETMQKEASEAWRLVGLAMVYHALDQTAASDEALAELVERYERSAASNIAYVMAFRGEADGAFEWLNKAMVYNDQGLSSITIQPLFANIHDDSRWLPFLESIGKSPGQLAAIKFNVTLPQ